MVASQDRIQAIISRDTLSNTACCSLCGPNETQPSPSRGPGPSSGPTSPHLCRQGRPHCSSPAAGAGSLQPLWRAKHTPAAECACTHARRGAPPRRSPRCCSPLPVLPPSPRGGIVCQLSPAIATARDAAGSRAWPRRFGQQRASRHGWRHALGHHTSLLPPGANTITKPTQTRSGNEILDEMLGSSDPVKVSGHLKLAPKEIAAVTEALITRMDKSEF